MQTLVELSVRPTNGPEIRLDSGHLLVRTFRADLTKRKGQIMSAVTPEVALSATDRMGVYVTLKNEAAIAAGKVGGHIANAAQWLREVLHLDAAYGYISAVGKYLQGKAAGVAALLGRTGMIGVAGMAVSTATGRKVLKAVTVTPVAYVARKVSHVYADVTGRIANNGKQGGARNWVADKMESFGNRIDAGVTKVVRSAVVTKAAHLLRLNGPVMNVVRTSSALAFALSAVIAVSTTTMPILAVLALSSAAALVVNKLVVRPIMDSVTVRTAKSLGAELWTLATTDFDTEQAAAIVVKANGNRVGQPVAV